MRGGTLVRKMLLHAAVSLTVIVFVFASSSRVFAGDTDTARNYLSTIVSCLSTIFALCISITLVAIQLTASRFTHRVLDLFLRLPINVSLILFYFVTIIQSLFLLSRITDPIHETLPSYLQPQMNADMVLVILCFAILVIYLYAVVQLLKPERIVAEIERECLAAIARKREREALDKVEQICDIAKRAAADMDSATGMMAIASLAKVADKGPPATRQSVTRQCIEIATIAAKEREGGMLTGVLESLSALGDSAMADGRFEDAREVVHALERIVRTGLVGQQLFHFIEQAVTAMYKMAVDAATGDPGPFAVRTFVSISRIGEEVLVREIEGAAYVARTMLSEQFGQLLRCLVAGARGGISDDTWRLLFTYASLAKIVIARAELRDLHPMTTWLRQELLDAKEDGQVLRVSLLLSVLLGALANASNRQDVLQLVVHAVASRYAWPETVVAAVLHQTEHLRPVFDYQPAVDHVSAVRRHWMAYRAVRTVRLAITRSAQT